MSEAPYYIPYLNVLRCSECERCGVPEVQHLPAGGRTQALARAQGRNVVLSPVCGTVVKIITQIMEKLLTPFLYQPHTYHIPHPVPRVCPGVRLEQ